MGSLADKILGVISKQPGITDRWLAEALFGPGTPQQRVNGECRSLADRGLLKRTRRPDGLIGNFVIVGVGLPPTKIVPPPLPHQTPSPPSNQQFMSEDELKKILERWLIGQGWTVEIAWARTPGIDLHARRNDQRWIIEAKGQGTLAPMRVNYFLGALGETLQRMDDPEAAYSLAFPDLQQFRNLWSRLPKLARERTKISALFVRHDGGVDKLK
jgi:hypothetical protein